MHADNAEIAEVLSTQIIKDIQVSHANNYFIAKSAASRGRSCAGPQKNVRHVFKRSWDIILGPAQDRPLQSVSNLRNLN